MATSAAVLEDGSVLSRLDQRLYRIEGWFALISGIAVLMLMVLAIRNVGGRHIANLPLSGYVDWIETAMALIAFLGLSYTQRAGGHIRMDILIGRLSGRALWAAEVLSTLLILILMVFLIWGTWSHFGRSFDITQPLWSRDCSIDICIPLWPSKLIVPLAFGVLSLRLLIQLYGYSRAFLRNDPTPVAVPLALDAAQQAAAEADAMTLRGGGPHGTD